MIQVSILLQHHAGPSGAVLVGKTEDGVWEFPHGTRRTNETEAEAVERICWEELGVKAAAGKLILEGHKYPDDGYTEYLYRGNITHNTRTKSDYHNYYEAVNKWQMDPKSGKYTELKWIHASALGTLEFADDDEIFMKKFDPWINPGMIPDVRMF